MLFRSAEGRESRLPHTFTLDRPGALSVPFNHDLVNTLALTHAMCCLSVKSEHSCEPKLTGHEAWTESKSAAPLETPQDGVKVATGEQNSQTVSASGTCDRLFRFSCVSVCLSACLPACLQ